MRDSLGDRMKRYEELAYRYISPNSYYVIRLDGKSFHSFVRRHQCEKPFDRHFIRAIDATAHYLLYEIQTAKMVYAQSDEISIFCDDLDSNETEHWFKGRINKIESISASMATLSFNYRYNESAPLTYLGDGLFDSRVIMLPNKSEVDNYLLWRQKDCERNSINTYAQSFFTHKQLLHKKVPEVIKMLHEIDRNWYDIPDRHKYGLLQVRGPVID